MILKELTSNQYYRGLNNRFDKRVVKLQRAGWVYMKTLNAWRHPKYLASNVGKHIQAGVIMHSDKRHFNSLIQ